MLKYSIKSINLLQYCIRKRERFREIAATHVELSFRCTTRFSNTIKLTETLFHVNITHICIPPN